MSRKDKSAFGPPTNNLIHIPPPKVHHRAVIIGGLSHSVSSAKREVNQKHERGAYTQSDGSFMPAPGIPWLAGRYKVIELIGKGQSSVVLKAQDMFQASTYVSLKVLHSHYNMLGTQETDFIRRLNQADPDCCSATLRLITTFQFDSHYCMVFELLHPSPLVDVVCRRLATDSPRPPACSLRVIRQITRQLLKALGFLCQQNVIHADLKPANLLLADASDFNSVKIVDFGNAIHCVHDELSLYYDDFEFQTLLYRAPEVIFGVPFGLEVDMWSLGCILAELYMQDRLFSGKDKTSVIEQVVALLGPLPCDVFRRGKFYGPLREYCRPAPQRANAAHALMRRMRCHDHAFASFVASCLRLDPNERLSVTKAAFHPFMAAELGLSYLLHKEPEVCEKYESCVPAGYKHSPRVECCEGDPLRQGTGDLLAALHATSLAPPPRSSRPSRPGVLRQVAQVVPLKREPGGEGLEPRGVGTGGRQERGNDGGVRRDQGNESRRELRDESGNDRRTRHERGNESRREGVHEPRRELRHDQGNELRRELREESGNDGRTRHESGNESRRDPRHEQRLGQRQEARHEMRAEPRHQSDSPSLSPDTLEATSLVQDISRRSSLQLPRRDAAIQERQEQQGNKERLAGNHRREPGTVVGGYSSQASASRSRSKKTVATNEAVRNSRVSREEDMPDLTRYRDTNDFENDVKTMQHSTSELGVSQRLPGEAIRKQEGKIPCRRSLHTELCRDSVAKVSSSEAIDLSRNAQGPVVLQHNSTSPHRPIVSPRHLDIVRHTTRSPLVSSSNGPRQNERFTLDRSQTSGLCSRSLHAVTQAISTEQGMGAGAGDSSEEEEAQQAYWDSGAWDVAGAKSTRPEQLQASESAIRIEATKHVVHKPSTRVMILPEDMGHKIRRKLSSLSKSSVSSTHSLSEVDSDGEENKMGVGDSERGCRRKQVIENTPWIQERMSQQYKMADDDNRLERQAPERQAPERQAPERQAPERQAPERQAPERQAPERQAPERQAPERQAPERQAPERQAPKRQAPERQPPKCDTSTAELTEEGWKQLKRAQSGERWPSFGGSQLVGKRRKEHGGGDDNGCGDEADEETALNQTFTVCRVLYSEDSYSRTDQKSKSGFVNTTNTDRNTQENSSASHSSSKPAKSSSRKLDFESSNSCETKPEKKAVVPENSMDSTGSHSRRFTNKRLNSGTDFMDILTTGPKSTEKATDVHRDIQKAMSWKKKSSRKTEMDSSMNSSISPEPASGGKASNSQHNWFDIIPVSDREESCVKDREMNSHSNTMQHGRSYSNAESGYTVEKAIEASHVSPTMEVSSSLKNSCLGQADINSRLCSNSSQGSERKTKRKTRKSSSRSRSQFHEDSREEVQYRGDPVEGGNVDGRNFESFENSQERFSGRQSRQSTRHSHDTSLESVSTATGDLSKHSHYGETTACSMVGSSSGKRVRKRRKISPSPEPACHSSDEESDNSVCSGFISTVQLKFYSRHKRKLSPEDGQDTGEGELRVGSRSNVDDASRAETRHRQKLSSEDGRDIAGVKVGNRSNQDVYDFVGSPCGHKDKVKPKGGTSSRKGPGKGRKTSTISGAISGAKSGGKSGGKSSVLTVPQCQNTDPSPQSSPRALTKRPRSDTATATASAKRRGKSIRCRTPPTATATKKHVPAKLPQSSPPNQRVLNCMKQVAKDEPVDELVTLTQSARGKAEGNAAQIKSTAQRKQKADSACKTKQKTPRRTPKLALPWAKKSSKKKRENSAVGKQRMPEDSHDKYHEQIIDAMEFSSGTSSNQDEVLLL